MTKRVLHILLISLIAMSSGILLADTKGRKSNAKPCANIASQLGSADRAPVGTTQWGKYTCASCGSQVTARPRTEEDRDQSGNPMLVGRVQCSQCGAPHTDENYFFEDTITKSNIADSDTSKTIAASGIKWACKSCGIDNFSTSTRCSGCGAFQTQEGPKKILINVENAMAQSASVDLQPSRKSKKRGLAFGLAGLGLMGLGGSVWWGFSSHDYSGHVTNMKWTHETLRDTYHQVTKSDWLDRVHFQQPRMPVNGSGEVAGAFNLRNERREYYETIQVPDGTETYQEEESYEEPYQDSEWEDNGNGSRTRVSVTRYRTKYRTVTKTRTRYRDEAVYKTKVDFDTFEWTLSGHEMIGGGDPAETTQREGLPWKTLSTGPLDRIRHTEDYTVFISYDVKNKPETYEFHPKSESEFLNWSVGQAVTIRRNNFGHISEVKPDKQNVEYNVK